VLANQQPSQFRRSGELCDSIVEAARAEAQHAIGMMDRQLGRRIGGHVERLVGPSEMALGFGEASHSHERRAGHREGADRHRLLGPAVLLGDGEGPLAQLERER
jgi:hypothetical protein